MENTHHTIIVKTQKSPTTAGLLAFFFGPIGMLYSTILGAVVMFVVTAIALVFTFGFGLFITIPICAMWAYMKVKNDNEKESVSLAHSHLKQSSTPTQESIDDEDLFN